MTETDVNGFPIKPGHNGRGIDIGEHVWLLKEHTGDLYGVFTTRHEAIGRAATLRGRKREWFTPVRVRAGSVRLTDVKIVS